MTNRALLTIVLSGGALALSACGGGDTAGTKASAPKAAAAPAAVARNVRRGAPAAATPAQAVEVKTPALTVPEGYRYDPRGRRDPFVNPIPKAPPPPPAPAQMIRPEGMKGMLVAETRVMGIIASGQPGMTKAIISSGKQTYFAVSGDALFDGVIKEIRKDGVVFTMISPVTKQPINKEAVVGTGNSGVTSTGEKK